MAADFGVDIDALDLNEPRFAIRKTRASNGPFTLFRHHRQLDIRVKRTRFFLPGGRDLHTAFLCHHGGRDHVYIGVGRLHDARDSSTVQRGQIHIGHRTIIKHVDCLDRLIRHLAHESAQMTGEFQPWAHNCRFFGGDGRHVQRVLNRARQQVIRHLFSHLQGHVFLRLGCGGTQMGGADNVWQVEQRIFRCGFHFKHVKGGTSHMAGFQCLDQGRFVNQAATGAVDDANSLFGFGKVLGRQDIAGLIRQRNMQGDEIGTPKQFIKINLCHAKGFCAFIRQEGIIGDNFHMQADRAVAHDATDIACADDAKGFIEQLYPHEPGFFPFSGMGGSVGFWNLPRHRKHHRNRMFRSGDRIAKRRIHHNDALFRCRGNINIVHTNARAPDDLQVGGKGQQLFRNFGR